jgi:magnesium-transporting ATPase (P-type)
MKETYTAQDSAFLASSASTSHGQQGSPRPPLPQESPEDDDEPPIRPPHGNHHVDIVEPRVTTSTRYDDVSRANLLVEKRPFDREPPDLAEYLHTSLSSGLDESEAQIRLRQCGKNILKGQEKVTVWLVLWRQVSNAMTVILLGALAIAFATNDYAEGGVIAGTFSHCVIYSSHRRCKCGNWLLSGIPC